MPEFRLAFPYPDAAARWTTLQNVTASPSRIGDIAKAALVLVQFGTR